MPAGDEAPGIVRVMRRGECVGEFFALVPAITPRLSGADRERVLAWVESTQCGGELDWLDTRRAEIVRRLAATGRSSYELAWCQAKDGMASANFLAGGLTTRWRVERLLVALAELEARRQ